MREKALKNIFHLGNATKKGMRKEEVRCKDEANTVWRQELENYFVSGDIRSAHSEEIKNIPQFVSLSLSENAVGKFWYARNAEDVKKLHKSILIL